MKKYSLIFMILPVFVTGQILNAQKDFNKIRAEKSAGEIEKIWIFFTDKGQQQEALLRKPSELISERAIERRLKVKPLDQIIDEKDLPVYGNYIEKISPHVLKIRAQSKWLNAVSVEIQNKKIENLSFLPFVKQIEPVHAFRRERPKEEKIIKRSTQPIFKGNADLDYGYSETQLSLINVPALHQMGIYGQGVLICMLDDGFNLLKHHIAFDSLDVVDTWDFINDDSSVDDSEFEATEGWHGTKTLSTIAGYVPGDLIGPAFKASFLLAKTEVNSSETAEEEDYWVEGLEWAENYGADIASSSLGYIDWYTWEEMDGETAVTTIAADLAVANGMIVVNSAGNEGFDELHNTLIAPADGNNVIAAAAVTSEGTRSSFSSVGPTADGRVKPDVAAMGSSVYVASSNDSAGFVYSSGTSFSCPLTSGAIALLLTAYPELTPSQVYEAITSTASQSSVPDNLLGWGILNIEAAYYSIDTADLHQEDKTVWPGFIYLENNYPNPFNPKTTIAYTLDQAAEVEIKIYDINGRLIDTFPQGLRKASTKHRFIHNYSNLASGIYIYEVNARELATGSFYAKSGQMILLK